jgi:hypothetical protein
VTFIHGIIVLSSFKSLRYRWESTTYFVSGVMLQTLHLLFGVCATGNTRKIFLTKDQCLVNFWDNQISLISEVQYPNR